MKRFRLWINLSLSLLVASGPLLPVYADTEWYMVKNNGKTIGQVRIDRYPSRENAEGVVTEISNTNYFTREGNPFEMNTVSRFVEKESDGKPLSFSYQYDLGSQRLLEAQGHFSGETLDVRMVRENTLATGQAPVSAEQFLFPGGPGIQKIYQAHYHDEPGSRFTFQTLSFGIDPQVVNTEVTLLGAEPLALAQGEAPLPLNKFEVRNPALSDKNEPQSGIHEWRDAKGRLYKAKSLGADGMEMVYASQMQASQASRNTLDVVAESSILTHKIPQPRITYEALYRLSGIHGQSLNWQAILPENSMQQIQEGKAEPQVPNSVLLQITQREPANALAEYPILSDPQYLASTPFVQASDPMILDTARQAVGKEKRAYYAARMLQQWVFQNIKHKDLSLGFSSAKETLVSRQGDCTEHAVLLAALGRSLGIPSRVAIGLIYLPDGNSQLGRFVYHMWNEVYVGSGDQGEWIALDATNPEALVDATHIKLADSALSSTQDLLHLTQTVAGLMGKLKIDVLKALSPSQSRFALGSQAGALNVSIPQIDIEQIDIQTLTRNAIQHFQIEQPPRALSLETADGLFTRGLELLAQGDAAQAEASFQTALKKAKQSRYPITTYRMGERLAGIEYYTLAKEAFEAARQKDPALSPLVDSWYAAYFPATLPGEALQRQFLSAILGNSAPTNLEQWLNRDAQAASFAPAWRYLGEHTGNPQNITALQHAIQKNPRDFRNYESLGDALMRQGQFSAASQAYRNAIQALQGTRFALSKSWVEDAQGKLALAQGAAALKTNKRNANGWLILGKGLLLQNRSSEALQAFENALKLNPSLEEARIYQFQLNLSRSNWAALDEQKNRLSTLANRNGHAAALLAQYAMRTRHYSTAVSLAQRAIALAPGKPDAYDILAQTRLRQAELENGKNTPKTQEQAKRLRQEALSALKRGLNAMKNAKDRETLALKLGFLQVEQGNAQEALALAENILAENPILGQAYLLRGKAQFYANQDETAKDSLQTALILNPNDPATLVQLGHIAQEEGHNAVAMDYYQRAYKADPIQDEIARIYHAMLAQIQAENSPLGRAAKQTDHWTLSADEQDYLVQLFNQVMRASLGPLDYLGQLAKLPGKPGQVDFNVKGAASVQAMQPLLEKLSAEGLAGYQRLQNMTPPSRMADYHYRVLLAYFQQLQTVKASGRHLVAFNSKPEVAKQWLENLRDAHVSLGDQVSSIQAKLPRAKYEQIVNEAHYSEWKKRLEQTNLSQIMSLYQTGAASQAPNKAAERADKNVIPAAGNAQPSSASVPGAKSGIPAGLPGKP